MNEDQIIIRSTLPYQVAILILINLWAFMCFELAQYQMVTLYQNPLAWIGWANLALLTMLPVLRFFTWKLKERVHLRNPIWNFKLREVNLIEFEEMTKNYNSSYRYLLSSFDYPSFILLLLCYVSVNIMPFFLMSSTILIIGLTPLIIALLVIIYGFLFSYFSFKLTSNSATPEFPTHSPRKLRKAISFLVGIPGIFWSGVRLTIGEAGGFYTIRDPVPIARIEGIEGAARLECVLDSSGNIILILPVFELDNLRISDQVGELIQPITPQKTARLIHTMISEYIQHSGGEEILDDVLQDIDAFLDKHEASKDSSN